MIVAIGGIFSASCLVCKSTISIIIKIVASEPKIGERFIKSLTYLIYILNPLELLPVWKQDDLA